MGQAWLRFTLAIHVLVGNGEQRDRLEHAVNAHLADLDASELPQELRSEFSRLKGQHFGAGSAADPSLELCTRTKQVDTESIVAIVQIFDKLARYQSLQVQLIRKRSGELASMRAQINTYF